MHRLSILFIFSLFCGMAYSQIQLKGPTSINPCDTIVYRYEVQLSSVADPVIRLELDYDHDYISNNLSDNYTEYDDGVEISLSDYAGCDVVIGEIAIAPRCIVDPIPLRAELYQIDRAEEVSMHDVYYTGQYMQLGFGPYRRDDATGTLYKSIRLTNIGLSPLENITIRVEIPEDVGAILQETTIGTIDESGDILIESRDWLRFTGESSLAYEQSVEMELIYAYEGCSLPAIGYEVINACGHVVCATGQEYIDENISNHHRLGVYPQDGFTGSGLFTLDRELIRESEFVTQYGGCEYYQNELTLRVDTNDLTDAEHDFYDISFEMLRSSSSATNFYACFDTRMSIGQETIEAEEDRGNRFFNIDFTADPDGPGGLDDLDGDGVYDDMRFGDSIRLSFDVLYDHECNFRIGSLDLRNFAFRLVYDIDCTESLDEVYIGQLPAAGVKFFRMIESVERDYFGERYITAGEQRTFRFNYRPNMLDSPECEDDSLMVVIHMPPIFERGPDDYAYYIIDRQDTVEWDYAADTVIEMMLDLDHSYSFEYSLTTICDPATQDLSAAQLCGEPSRYSITAEMSQICQSDDGCVVEYAKYTHSVNAFRVICPEISDAIETPIILDDISLRRRNRGWTDNTRAVRFVGENGETVFTEVDTMEVSIPFELVSVEALDDMRLLITTTDLHKGLYYTDVEATIRDDSGAMICMGGLILASETSDDELEIRFDTSSDLMNCLSEGESYEINLSLTLRTTQHRSDNERFTVYLLQELEPDCEIQTGLKTTNFRYYPYFSLPADEIGVLPDDISMIPFVNSPISINLYEQGGLTQEIVDGEYRGVPYVTALKVSLPTDYYIRDDVAELIIEEHSLNTADLFNPIFESQVDRYPYRLISKVESGGMIDYFFEPITLDSIVTAPLYSIVHLEFEVGSLCSIPSGTTDQLELSVDIQYQDRDNGSLELISQTLTEEIDIYHYGLDRSIADDFIVVDTEEPVVWHLEHTFSERFLRSAGLATEPDTVLIQVSDAQLDSIRFFDDRFNDPFELYGPTFQLLPAAGPDQWYFVYSKSTGYQELPVLDLYTSGHDCGYDTTYVEYTPFGYSYEDCPEAIFRDTLVTYIPTSFIYMDWAEEPTLIKACSQNQWSINVSNVGAGYLDDMELILESEIAEHLDLYWQIDGAPPVPLVAEEEIAGVYRYALGERTLSPRGAAEGTHRATIIIESDAPCYPVSATDISLRVEARDYCDQLTISALRVDDIPIRQSDRPASFETEMYAVADAFCDDFTEMNIAVKAIRTEQIIQDGTITLRMPAEVPYVSGSARWRGEMISHPIILLDGEEQILRWRLPPDQDLSTPALLSFELITGCVNPCADYQYALYIDDLSEETCDGTLCSSRTVVAHQAPSPMELRPEFIFRTIESSISADVDTPLVQIAAVLRQNNSYEYAGQLTLHLFSDENANDSLDQAERLWQSWDYDSLSLRYDDLALQIEQLIPAEQICNLVLALAEDDCQCYYLSQPLDFDNSALGASEVYVCPTDRVDLSAAIWGDCDRQWRAHSSIVDDGGVLYYDPTASADISDTLIADLDCFGCESVDTIYFIQEELEAELVVTPSAESCDDRATVRLLLNRELRPTDQITWQLSTVEGDIQMITDSLELTGSWQGRIDVTIEGALGCSIQLSAEAPAYETFPDEGYRLDISSLYVAPGEPVSIDILDLSPDVMVSWDTELSIDCDSCRSVELIGDAGDIRLMLTSPEGCIYRDTLSVELQIDPRVYIPNAFSPNDDGINDTFYPTMNSAIVEVETLEIYDRWGNRLYGRYGVAPQDAKWDGTRHSVPLPSGVYMYRMTLIQYDEERSHHSGSVTLLR